MTLISRFNFEKVLSSNTQTKTIAVLGTIDGENAIISIELAHFRYTDSFIPQEFISKLSLIDQNDVYHWFSATLQQDLENHPGAKVNVIFPATETHIRKFSEQNVHYVVETPEMYHKFAVPYIQTMKGDRIKWVYNILFEGKESETFVHHDKDPETGFVLLPDMKWDRVNMALLYLCCIVNRLDISSVRDLNETHLEFLRDLREKIVSITSKVYGLERDQLRLFIHYHPSYYHFHIHVVNVRHQGLGDGINVGKAILLDDVIENISLMGDYYQKKNIGFVLGENHGLWQSEGYRAAIEEK